MLEKIYKNRKRILPVFFLFCILLFASFFRFYHFKDRISMEPDSARDAFVALIGAKHFQFPLTGPFISISPVTTGPWYWIQLIVGSILIPSSYAPWIVIGIYSLLTVATIFVMGFLVGGLPLAIFSSILAALSGQQIDTAIQLTNPSVIGFYSSLCVVGYILVVKYKKLRKYSFLWGIVIGLTINSHYQSAGLLLLPLFFGLFTKEKKRLFQIFLGCAVTFIPLVIFELNNHWFNLRNMIQYLRYDQYKFWVPNSWTLYLRDLWPSYLSFVLGGSKNLGYLWGISMGIGIMWTVLQKKESPLKTIARVLFLVFFIQFVMIRYYRGEKFFGYLQFFHPFIFLFIGLFFSRLREVKFGKILSAILFVFFIFLIFPSSFDRIKSGGNNMNKKNEINQLISDFGEGPFHLYRCTQANNSDIASTVLWLTLDKKYAANVNQGKNLFYNWGNCQLPIILRDGSELKKDSKGNLIHPYSKSGIFIYDVSSASPSAFFSENIVEASPESMYQSAARWWMDEQP